ncbi:sialidase family protein [Archangium lansingense]|uniref:Sialidase family protein n=1 Tax=Archangium lansingense TaxID=2995310 RepID=A0ABT4AG79_9BACT|nr:sialidase family protein [Archangium lansinium]MCY1080684.1 sialidase family protein [Archangium lansinium]
MQRHLRFQRIGVCLLAGLLVAASPLAASGAGASERNSHRAVDELGSRKNLSNTPTDSSEPRVAVSGNHVYVVWLEHLGDTAARILFRVSHDGGKRFSGTRVLNPDGGTPRGVNLLAHESRVYVAWGDDAGDGGVRLRASLDHGSSFGPVRKLSETGNPSSPLLAASGNHVYVVWSRGTGDESGDILFRASHDQGKSFGPLLDLNEDDEIGSVDLAARGHNVYLVWDDGFVDDLPAVRFRRSTDKGDTFEPIQRLSLIRSQSTHPRLAVRNDDVYLTWSECEFPDPVQCEILFRRSTNEGATFEPPVNLSENPGPSVEPEIAVEHDHLYVTWMDSTPGNFDIFFRKSDDRGRSFEPGLNLSDNPGTSFAPRISAEDDFVRVVWQDATGSAPFPLVTEVLYRASDDEGDSFSPTVNLSDNPGSSESPQLATCQDGERVHFVWLDDTPGQFDIFYRRGEAE